VLSEAVILAPKTQSSDSEKLPPNWIAIAVSSAFAEPVFWLRTSP